MRPAISVVVPFAGSAEAARRALANLGRLTVRHEDELVLVDNTAAGIDAHPGDRVRVVRAPHLASSYHARNVGARATTNEWLLFLDDDCVAPADLLERFFAQDPPNDDVGAVAGGVQPTRGQDQPVARYATARRHLDQALNAEHPYKPMAVTANLLVRRSAYEEVGGFLEVRSGGDSDFCWRLQDQGWRLTYNAHAAVEHRHRESLRPLARQLGRYAAGAAWLERRHPGATRRPKLVAGLTRSALGTPYWLLRGDRERALHKAIDAVAITAEAAGRLADNAPTPIAPSSPSTTGLDVVMVVDLFPELSQTFVANEARALIRAGNRVRILAAGRGLRPEPSLAHGLEARYMEDDGDAETVRALLWLGTRHPLKVVSDLLARKRWREEEKVRPLRQLAPAIHRLSKDRPRLLHAHFASEPALDALRIGRILGLPFSVTAHGYDIFQRPANLAEKLGGAHIVTTGCDYNLSQLRAQVPTLNGRGHRIVMGVDGEEFHRRTPYPGTRHVVAVGRLVEKKGFADLIDAAKLLHDAQQVDRVTIVGDGPLREQLVEQIKQHGLDRVVELTGALAPHAVRDLLERADVLAMPCVVASDGDRDSMPVVVKEALAMEVPVVATEEVGLPEVVRPPWGRLAPPHDPEALAAALDDVLRRPATERQEMGRAGRHFVLRTCDVDRESRRLAELLAA